MSIVDSDAFLDMPSSTQCLYFHLNMRADDDGFIGNPKRIIRLIGASEDDLKLLIAKNFVLTFENGVIVIKHWRMHNTLSKRRYRETQYIDEKKELLLKANGSYSFNSGNPIDDSKLVGMFNENKSGEQTENTDLGLDLDLDLGLDLGLGSDLDLDQDITVSNDTVCQTDIKHIMEKWNELESFGVKPIVRINRQSKRGSCLVARIKEYGVESVFAAIERIKNSNYLQGKNRYSWTITFDWFVLPNNFPKVLEGNYDNSDKANITGPYQSNTEKMLEHSYDMMSKWVQSKENGG